MPDLSKEDEPEILKIEKDAELEADLDVSGEGRQSLADRIIERIRRALSPRSDGRQTDHDADDESESDIEGQHVNADGVIETDVKITDKKEKKRTKRMKKRSKDKDKKLKAKKKKRTSKAPKDTDDVSDKIDYATEYPDDKIVIEAPETETDKEHDTSVPKVSEELVAKVLASADEAPPPLPDKSPPKSPEHQAGIDVQVEGKQYCIEAGISVVHAIFNL